jgi:hypothetical protein
MVVCDRWLGNNGLLKPLRQELGSRAQLLSRLRSNAELYDLPTRTSVITCAILYPQPVWHAADGQCGRKRGDSEDYAVLGARGLGLPHYPMGRLGHHRYGPVCRANY